MTYYYCTCSKDKGKKRAVDAGRTPFREVNVYDDGSCVDCGYYAVAYFESIDPIRTKLYDKLFNTGVDEPSSNVKGGLSLMTAKQIKKMREANDPQGKSKDGDMDV